MLHDEIRDARVQAGLSQNTLAKLAGVPRSQLRKLEEGGNVTLTTVQKVLAQLPGVQLTLAPAKIDEPELREAVTVLMEAAQLVLDVLGGGRTQATERLDQRPAGAARHEPGQDSELETARRLEAHFDKLRAASPDGKVKGRPQH